MENKAGSQKYSMSDLSVRFFFFKGEKYAQKSQSPKEKIKYIPMSTTGIAAKMWTNSQWAFYVF